MRVRGALKDAEFEKEEAKRDKKRKTEETAHVDKQKDEKPKALPASDEKPSKKKKISSPAAVDEIFSAQNSSSLDAASVPNLYFVFLT